MEKREWDRRGFLRATVCAGVAGSMLDAAEPAEPIAWRARASVGHRNRGPGSRPVILNRDVETLVADPAFAGTRVGQTLNELADKY
jgi:hypothetical protein